MKTPSDPRHLRREKTVKLLFSYGFKRKNRPAQSLKPILAALTKIDRMIHLSASEWPLEQINRIDLAILRLAVYELAVNPTEPPLVIIDEAVELAKKFGSEKSPGFVNGVLGTVLEKHLKREKKA
jgi:transcription antitermination factor NusB